MALRIARNARRFIPKNVVAADVMIRNQRSVRQSASVRETAGFLLSNGMHVAPVIDEAGRPVGVVSRTDLLNYEDGRRDRLAAIASGEVHSGGNPPDAPFFDLQVKDIMTPVVYSVPMGTPIGRVIRKIAALQIRCLFVTDEHGVLVGAIDVFDLLKTSRKANDLTATGC